MYVFDTSSFKELLRFYPKRFPSLWKKCNVLVSEGGLISVTEVLREIEMREDTLSSWAKENKKIFQHPTPEEAGFIGEIFAIPHFQHLMERKKQLRGGPFADPFVIAKAKITKATLVTEERLKPNGAKIPNVCKHFSIDCINLEDLMEKEDWTF